MLARRLAPLVLIVAVAGCGGGGGSGTPQAGDTATSLKLGARTQLKPKPVQVDLRLDLPFIGPSTAPVVSYKTGKQLSTLSGIVKPASASVFLVGPGGRRSAVTAQAEGRFKIRMRLNPGRNVFQFTAAQLGAKSRQARLAVTLRGRHAAAGGRSGVLADPDHPRSLKDLPPASAGLKQKDAPPVGGGEDLPGGVPSAVEINPLNLPPPPASGGNGTWYGGFELTEYYPALESWFNGAAVKAPGLPDAHRIDWLYSATGLSMEGDGIGLDGRQYHIAGLGSGGWVDKLGRPSGFTPGIFWRTGGFWRNSKGNLTYPLADGGWFAGTGKSYVPEPSGISFAPGTSHDLRYYRSIAVDPGTIPLGSKVFIPAYEPINGGWFVAQDTGGAIDGRHIDVFRPPPADPNTDKGNYATGERVYVVLPGH